MREPLPPAARAIAVDDARAMNRAMRRHAARADAIVMAAAVSDFRPVRVAMQKLRRRGPVTLRLEATPDILARLPKRVGQLRVGFALETAHVLSRATRKLRAKRLDMVLAQQTEPTGAPFGRTKVRAWLISRDGTVARLGRRSKAAVARALLDKVERLWYGQRKVRCPVDRSADSSRPAERLTNPHMW